MSGAAIRGRPARSIVRRSSYQLRIGSPVLGFRNNGEFHPPWNENMLSSVPAVPSAAPCRSRVTRLLMSCDRGTSPLYGRLPDRSSRVRRLQAFYTNFTTWPHGRRGRAGRLLACAALCKRKERIVMVTRFYRSRECSGDPTCALGCAASDVGRRDRRRGGSGCRGAAGDLRLRGAHSSSPDPAPRRRLPCWRSSRPRRARRSGRASASEAAPTSMGWGSVRARSSTCG